MFYDIYQAQQDLLAPLRASAGLTAMALEKSGAAANNGWMGIAAAGAQLFARARMTHERPLFDIAPVMVAGQPREVIETPALDMPFARLLHFHLEADASPRPCVLLVAPMAGHFATLLRGTVQTMLADHDVFITDWKNARDVPPAAGRFGTDEYIDYLMTFLAHIGEGVHAVAVCQPCPTLLAAAALMAEDGHPATPRSLTLMAGPVDTRISPTRVNTMATQRPLDWFAQNLITSVPARYAGAYRHVYPGFLQLSAFVGMNWKRHTKAHMELFAGMASGARDQADSTCRFYDEYFAVADMTAEFYLETVQKVFQEHHLGRGIYAWRGRTVDPGALCGTSLLTVEGGRDDICGPGQTRAAHDLCVNIAPSRKRHHVQAEVGHYGVFSGSRWNGRIYPMVKDIIAAAESMI